MFKYERLKEARVKKEMSLSKLSELTQIPKATLQRYETGYTTKVPMDAIDKIEKALNLKNGYLMGWESNVEITEDYTEFPVICEVAAGFDKYGQPVADEFCETVQIPNSYLRGRNFSDFFVMKVKGDSMYPQFLNGDKLLVLKQSTMNYSGEIGVFLYDNDKITLKKIEYKQGENWVNLVAINPNYPPTRIENDELDGCRVLGVPKLLIREFE